MLLPWLNLQLRYKFWLGAQRHWILRRVGKLKAYRRSIYLDLYDIKPCREQKTLQAVGRTASEFLKTLLNGNFFTNNYLYKICLNECLKTFELNIWFRKSMMI